MQVSNWFSWVKTFPVETFSALALVLLTAVLARYTYVLAREAKNTREAQARPLIVVSVEAFRSAVQMQLVIENLGPGLAKDVHIWPTKEIWINPRGQRVRLLDQEFLRQPMLKPGQRVRVLIGRFGEIETRQFSFKSECKDIYENTHVDFSEFNFGTVKNTMIREDYELQEISRNLKDISDALKQFGTGSRKLRVNVYGRADRAAEAAAEEEWFNKQLSPTDSEETETSDNNLRPKE